MAGWTANIYRWLAGLVPVGVALLPMALAVLLALGTGGEPPRGCARPAPKPEPLPFLCHTPTGECFTVHSSCVMYLSVFGGDCFEIPRAWCLRREDLSERSRDPNMDCFTTYALCAEVFEMHGAEEQCFTLDDAWILHEHKYWQ